MPPITKKRKPNDDKALIVIEHYAESMDVTLTHQVFSKLGMQVVYAGRHKHSCFKLTGNIQLQAQTTFGVASRKQWKVIVLPGGNKAVAKLHQSSALDTLLKNHVLSANNGGLIAAMGASATQLLSGIYVDKLGPTCYPVQGEATVVNFEHNNQVLTAPGLGTATELALAVGETLYGRSEAQRVADEVGYLQGDWDITKLRDLKSHHCVSHDSREEQLGSPVWRRRSADKVKHMLTGFWEIVWPKLSDMGWKCDFAESERWVFWRPGIEHWKSGRRGRDWFDSQGELLEHLSGESCESSKDIMEEFTKKVAAEEKKKKSKKRSRGVHDIPLFEHVVWNRLEFLGWRRLAGGGFLTPLDHSPRAELKSPERVLRHLLSDPELRSRSEILAIVDLFKQCELTRKSLTVDKTPEEIEALTKREFPAVCLY